MGTSLLIDGLDFPVKKSEFYGNKEAKMEINKNQKYIVRCDRSGVFFGNIEYQKDREVQLNNARCLWYWDGGSNPSSAPNIPEVQGVGGQRECVRGVPKA